MRAPGNPRSGAKCGYCVRVHPEEECTRKQLGLPPNASYETMIRKMDTRVQNRDYTVVPKVVDDGHNADYWERDEEK